MSIISHLRELNLLRELLAVYREMAIILPSPELVAEDANIKRLTLLQGGTVKPSDITNIKLKTDTKEWSGTVTSTGYLVYDLGTGFLIPKGEESVFKVYGDLGGKKDEDVDLYFENV